MHMFCFLCLKYLVNVFLIQTHITLNIFGECYIPDKSLPFFEFVKIKGNMGLLFPIIVESKLLGFLVDEGIAVVRINERTRVVYFAILLERLIVEWLLSIWHVSIRNEEFNEAHCHSNNYGKCLAIEEYCRVGKKGLNSNTRRSRM